MQITSSHFMFLHIPKMMVNAIATSQPIVEYSTRLLFLLFSTILLLLFFSIILLPPLAFVCAHSFVLPFPLLFFIISQLHLCIHATMNFRTSKMHTTSNNKHKLLLTITPFCFVLVLAN
jgi:hypothetical protein